MRNKDLENDIFNYIKDHSDKEITVMTVRNAFPNDPTNSILNALVRLYVVKKITKRLVNGLYTTYTII